MDVETIHPEIRDGNEEATCQPTTEIIPPDDEIITDDLNDLITRWVPWITLTALLACSLILLCCIFCSCSLIVKKQRSNAMGQEMREL